MANRWLLPVDRRASKVKMANLWMVMDNRYLVRLPKGLPRMQKPKPRRLLTRPLQMVNQWMKPLMQRGRPPALSDSKAA